MGRIKNGCLGGGRLNGNCKDIVRFDFITTGHGAFTRKPHHPIWIAQAKGNKIMLVINDGPTLVAIIYRAAMQAMLAKVIGVELVHLSTDSCLSLVYPIGVTPNHCTKRRRIAWVMFEFWKAKNQRLIMPD